MKATKCLSCPRIGQYKNGTCFWCNRKQQFQLGLRLGIDNSQYTGEAHNQIPCAYPNCKDTRNRGSTSKYCIMHRVKANRIQNANIRTN